MSKDAVVLVVDVSPSMGVCSSDGQCGLDMAKKAISLMIQQKLIHPKQDEIGIVTVGATETFNALADKDEGNYRHIRVIQPIAKPDISFLKTVDELEVEDGEGDVVDALLVAMELLSTRVGRLKFNKRVFLITDAACPISWAEDEDGLSSIVQGIVAAQYRVNVIGINFSDVEEAEEDDGIPLVRHGSAVDRRTLQQQRNERLLRDLCDRADGVVFNVDSALSLMRTFRKQINQVTKFRGPLQIGQVSIEVYTYTQTQMQSLPTMKKQVTEAERVGGEGKAGGQGGRWGGGWGGEGKDREEKWSSAAGGGEAGGGGGGGDGADGGDDGDEYGYAQRGSGLHMKRAYWDKTTDAHREVDDASMRVRAFRYGKDLVPFNETEEELLKYQSEKCLQVLAFVDADKVGRWQFMSGVDCVCAAPGDEQSGRALSAFVLGCLETNKVALCRYVARKNARPMLVALLPDVRAKEQADVFYLVQLPFAEDVRDYNFANFDSRPAFIPDDAQRTITRDWLRAMNLDTADTDEDGRPVPALEPDETYNPVLQHFYQAVKDRALDPSCPIPPLDPLLAKSVEPDASLLKAAEPAFRAFKSAFPLTVTAKKEEQKRRFLMYDQEAPIDEDLQQASKRVRAEEEEGNERAGGGGLDDDSLGFDTVMRGRVDRVGTVDPVADFRAMLRRRDDITLTARAEKEMIAVCDALIDNSYGDSMYDKAVSCIVALREGCVRAADAEPFNGWLDGRRELWQQRYRLWWERMKREGIRPIDTAEVADSRYEPHAADRWYEDNEDISKSRSESLPVSAPEDEELYEGLD